MRDSRVIIAGVVRNAIDVLPRTIERVEQLAKLFGDCRVVVYENDSIDGTRELLTAWAAGTAQVSVRCDAARAPINPKTRCKLRGDRMADYRNWYHRLIASRFANFDHVIVLDLDLPGGWSNDGIANTFGCDDWDFVGSNGLILQRHGLRFNAWLQFDAWAFRRFGSFDPMSSREVNNYIWRRGSHSSRSIHASADSAFIECLRSSPVGMAAAIVSMCICIAQCEKRATIAPL